MPPLSLWETKKRRRKQRKKQRRHLAWNSRLLVICCGTERRSQEEGNTQQGGSSGEQRPFTPAHTCKHTHTHTHTHTHMNTFVDTYMKVVDVLPQEQRRERNADQIAAERGSRIVLVCRSVWTRFTLDVWPLAERIHNDWENLDRLKEFFGYV